MLGTIVTPQGETLPRLQYMEMLAAKYQLTVERVQALGRHCENDDMLPDDAPSNEYNCVEEYCKAVEHTKLLREGANPRPVKSEVVIANSQEQEMVEVGRSARLDGDAYQKLREVFDFADDMSAVRPKPNVIIAPTDWARLYGLGWDLGRRSIWLMADAINHLMVLGHENVVVQLSDHFGLSHSYIYNLARAAQRVLPHKRTGLLPSVVVEIASRTYSDDAKENTEKIEGLLQEAKEHNYNCLQARSAVRAAMGKDEVITGDKKKSAKERIQELESVIRWWLDYEGDSLDSEFESMAKRVLGIVEL